MCIATNSDENVTPHATLAIKYVIKIFYFHHIIGENYCLM